MHCMARPISFPAGRRVLIARIDAARGLIPRSAFVRQAIERQILAANDLQADLDAIAANAGMTVKEFVVPREYLEGVERHLGKPTAGLGKGYVAPIPKKPKR